MSSPFDALAASGINLHAVFDLADLPPEVRDSLDEDARGRFTQLILLGHLGRGFWTALQRRGMHGSDPVDSFATECVKSWMQGPMAGHAWRQVFPGPQLVGLQRLGALAGWHHASPFWVGVDAEWGSWFAYRAVVLADTALPATPRRVLASPCETCAHQACVKACPAGALASGAAESWRLQACLDYRRQPGSACQDRCLARNACPVGESYRYGDGQIAYHYLNSMQVVRKRF